MRAVILAGGKGTRFSSNNVRPKPLQNVVGKPILWHVMKIFDQANITDFVICVGHKKECFFDYFANYSKYNSIIKYSTQISAPEVIEGPSEEWSVVLKDSGPETDTAGRLSSTQSILGNETFCLTYGDSVVDVDVSKVIDFHRKHKKIATVTAIKRRSALGELTMNGNDVVGVSEKKISESDWINGGFFVFEPSVFDLISEDKQSLENQILPELASMGQLKAYKHDGFWHPMDTVKDKDSLENYLSRNGLTYTKVKN
jgi:glucose-1-phosphate cytidylyltransferase